MKLTNQKQGLASLSTSRKKLVRGFIAITAVIIMSFIMLSCMTTIAFIQTSAQRDLLLQTTYSQALLSAKSCAQYAIGHIVIDSLFSKQHTLSLEDIQCSIVSIQIKSDGVHITTTGTFINSTVTLETVYDSGAKKILSQREK